MGVAPIATGIWEVQSDKGSSESLHQSQKRVGGSSTFQQAPWQGRGVMDPPLGWFRRRMSAAGQLAINHRAARDIGGQRGRLSG